MTDESTYVGGSVGPVGPCSVTELKVTDEHKEKHGHNKKREHRGQAGKNVDEMVGELNHAMHAAGKRIAFSVGTEGMTRVLQIIDMDSNEVIKRLPLDDLLCTERWKDLLGVLVDRDG